MQADIEIISDEERLRPTNSEVNRLLADNTKAKNLIGWTPEFGGVEGFKRGLKKTVDWFSVPDNIKMYKSDIYNI